MREAVIVSTARTPIGKVDHSCTNYISALFEASCFPPWPGPRASFQTRGRAFFLSVNL